MSVYKLTSFDGIELPLYNPETDLGTGTVESSLLASVGGTFDTWGSYQRLPHIVRHMASGIYASVDGSLYITDHSGSYVTDHSSNRIIAATADMELRRQVENIRAKVGTSGSLWRARWDSTSVLQWKTARLLSVQQKVDTSHRLGAAKVDCIFESAMANWRSETASSASATLVANGTTYLNVTSGGNAQVDDAIITFTSSGSITSLQLTVPGYGIDLRWVGSLTTGQSLVINCGTQSVTKSGSNAYSGFSLGSGHTVRGWLPLPPGLYVCVVGSDADGTVQVSHYDQWV